MCGVVDLVSDEILAAVHGDDLAGTRSYGGQSNAKSLCS